jgi:hypothetical protein
VVGALGEVGPLDAKRASTMTAAPEREPSTSPSDAKVPMAADSVDVSELPDLR